MKYTLSVNDIYAFLTIGQPLKENTHSIMTQHFCNDAMGLLKFLMAKWYISVLKTI